MAVKASRRRRKRKLVARRIVGRIALALLAIPGFYLLAALVGGLIPVNREWVEPDDGVRVYVADNGIHADLILPVREQGLDWRRLLPASDVAAAPSDAKWVAFGMGEERVYLETPRWRDITPVTVWHALAGGQRVMHVEWVRDPAYSAREIRLTPEQYRRLWASVRAGFDLDRNGRPQRIDHPGYHSMDAFYRGVGKANAIATCNQWAADRLRLAGVKAPLWSPFVQGLTWRYREAEQS